VNAFPSPEHNKEAVLAAIHSSAGILCTRASHWRRRPSGYLAVFSTFARLRPLTQLNMTSQPFYDSAPDYNAYNWAAHAGLTCVALGPHGSSTKILPCLDRIAEKPAWVSFDAW
jgi:hypothetical protein